MSLYLTSLQADALIKPSRHAIVKYLLFEEMKKWSKLLETDEKRQNIFSSFLYHMLTLACNKQVIEQVTAVIDALLLTVTHTW